MVLLTPLYPKTGISYDVKLQKTSDGVADKARVTFGNSADVARAVHQGYIEVDGVTVELSDEAKRQLDQSRERADQQNAAYMMQEMAEHNAEAAKQQGEAMEDGFNELAKAIETARRISKGGKVPPLDEQKLLEFDSVMYQTAKLAAMNAKKHKKHKSLYGDEEEDSSSGSSGNSLEENQTVMQTEMEVSMTGDAPQVTVVTEVMR